MNLGQTMITLGMLILLIMTVISANRMIMENSTGQLETQALAASSMIASDLFAEILSKPFDWGVKGAIDTVYTDSVNHLIDTLWKQETTGLVATSSFTAYKDTVHWGGWGVRRVLGVSLPDVPSSTGEYRSRRALKDVDDYDGYSRTVTYSNISGFTATVSVHYVTSTAPDVPDLVNKQNFKQIVIAIQHSQYLSPADTFKAVTSY